MTEIKWLAYSSRFDIWGQSRSLMLEYKEKFNAKKIKITNDISSKIKAKLALNSI